MGNISQFNIKLILITIATIRLFTILHDFFGENKRTVTRFDNKSLIYINYENIKRSDTVPFILLYITV